MADSFILKVNRVKEALFLSHYPKLNNISTGIVATAVYKKFSPAIHKVRVFFF
jgi:hypothetical protein